MHNRREFLKCSALSAVAMPLVTQSLFAQDAMPENPADSHLFPVSYGKKIHPPAIQPRKISIPNVEEFKVLKGDFHIHTLFSDGRVMPKDRVLEAVDNGFDVISITDHIEYRPFIGRDKLKLAENNDDHNASYDNAKPEADKHKLLLVRGAEITKPEWHFNVLFVKDINPIAAAVDDWTKMIAVAVEQGGFVQWNHPSWIDRTPDDAPFGLKKGEPMRFFDEIEGIRKKGHLHGIEVFSNSACLYNAIAHDWCNERDLVVMSNTDIHPSELERFGRQNLLRPMTLVLAKERTLESIQEAFFAKRTVGWAANMILGRNPWVEKLFRSCVGIEKSVTGVTLRNRSDIPCVVEASDKTSELPAKGTVEIRDVSAKKLTVSKWFVGMNKPLEIIF